MLVQVCRCAVDFGEAVYCSRVAQSVRRRSASGGHGTRCRARRGTARHTHSHTHIKIMQCSVAVVFPLVRFYLLRSQRCVRRRALCFSGCRSPRAMRLRRTCIALTLHKRCAQSRQTRLHGTGGCSPSFALLCYLDCFPVFCFVLYVCAQDQAFTASLFV